MAIENTKIIGGLTTIVVEPAISNRTTSIPPLVVLLHGYAMRPADLAPFAHSLGINARFLLPQAMAPTPSSGFAWWPIDEIARAREQLAGPRDLYAADPPGLREARATIAAFIREAAEIYRTGACIIGGFSQGGMLACDCVLSDPGTAIAGLFLLSSSRLSLTSWAAQQQKLRAMPILVSHGRLDTDLAFSAGERLRDFVTAAGATVTWVPFDTGHEVPLVVWRQLRKFLTTSIAATVINPSL